MPIKIFHTADVHLGAQVKFLGEKAKQHRRQLRETFSNTVQLAVSESAHVFLIAGDLFDTPFPDREDVKFVADQFSKLSQAKIFTAVIPGNHDYLEQGSVFFDPLLVDLAKSSDYLYIFNQKAQSWLLDQLKLQIYAVPTATKTTQVSPLADLKIEKKSEYLVGLVHGSLDIGGGGKTQGAITKEEIKATGFAYLALGDWHSKLEVSQDPVAWYSGSPELINISQQDSGHVLEVTLENGKTTVKPRTVGIKQVEKLELDLQQFDSQRALSEHIKKQIPERREDIFLALKLTGHKKLTVKYDFEELQEDLGKDFYYVKLTDTSTLELTEQELSQFPPELVIGKYIRHLQEKKTDDYAQNQLIDEAIQLGVQMLTDI